MYQPIYRPISTNTLGEVLVDRQIYRLIGVSVDSSVNTPQIYRPILDRVSTNVSTYASVDISVEAPHKIHDPNISFTDKIPFFLREEGAGVFSQSRA